VSGVCGVLRLDGGEVDPSDLERQVRALAHLGPDRRQAISDGVIGLGHLGLRITHEDYLDAQPLQSGGILLAADVRLDNRELLAAQLSIDAASLAAMPDSALVLAAYRHWGADCAGHLLGDFAFAIWDGAERRLVLARDHFGQRRLFFHRGADFFAFATEVKGLWALPDVPRVLPEIEIARRLLISRTRAPGEGPFEGFGALPGATTMTVTADGAVRQSRYWRPQAAPEHLDRDEAYYRRAYREVLGEAVACRLRRNVKPAALLFSAGFDSGAIAALAAPAIGARRLVCVSSVAAAPATDGRDPRRWVELCARHMPHLDVRYVTCEGKSPLVGVEQAFLAGDGPHSPNRYVRDELYRVAADAGARVVMDGHGGDYTLNPRDRSAVPRLLLAGQFRRFVAEFNAQRRSQNLPLWKALKSLLVATLAPGPIVRAWRQHLRGLAPFGATLPVRREFVRTASQLGVIPFGGRPTPVLADSRSLPSQVLRRMQDMVAQGGAISAAARGLEFTQPFHDKRVIELALAIPGKLQFRDGRPRYLAREALGELLPSEFQTRGAENSDFSPDFMSMARRIEPQLLADIDRLEKSPALSRYFDFAKMRRMLVQKGTANSRRFETRTQQAMLAYLYARYIEWFRRENS
jgi:asparagine synthase (glutamine-hydrolysing)